MHNVKEINFVIRDVKFLPHQAEIAHEFEINPTDILFNSYDITEKNKLQHFSKARNMHDFIQKHINIHKVNTGIRIGGNVLIIDEDFMIQGSSSLEVSKKMSRELFNNINFDTILNGSADREQILGALDIFKQIWFNEQVSVDYKEELLASLRYVYKEHSPEFLYYFTLNELFGNQLDVGVERFEKDSTRFKKTEIWNKLNNYVHSNGYRFYNESYNRLDVKNKIKEECKEFGEAAIFITISFLFLLVLIKPLLIMSSDYTDYLDVGDTPPDGSQYWVAPFVSDFLNNHKNVLDDKCDSYLREKTGMQI